MARGGAVPAAACRMLHHPSLIHATLVELAGGLGVPPAAVRFAFWFVALWLLMRVALAPPRPLTWVMDPLAGLLARVAGCTVASDAREFLATAATRSGRTHGDEGSGSPSVAEGDPGGLGDPMAVGSGALGSGKNWQAGQ